MRKAIFSFIILFVITGCSSGGTPITITDSTTKPTIITLTQNEVNPDQFVYNHNYDNMDRGNHDYEGQVVIDLKYYNKNAISRGDIVYFKNPETKKNLGEYSISRVIGLPGEKVKIDKGQIYINGKFLDTFYGRAHRGGHDLESLKKILKNSDLDNRTRKNIENDVNYFQESTKNEIEIPEDSVYLVGDDWLRSNDSRFFTPIPTENVEGKVLGVIGP
ncbi:signal peptidase I [Paenibacillus solisilvae]|uniref:Signal peptidase I n=1 Tax=Paenibacillus solisilvae TaxID=2486751 RepID=A0ABW0W0S1_9BACL